MATAELEIVDEKGKVNVDAVNAMVDRMAAGDKKETAPPPDKATETETHPDEKSVKDDVDTAKPEEKADRQGEGEEVAEEDWRLAQDLRELVESLGLSEGEVKEFTSREEFDRAARLLDKQLVAEGKKTRPKPGDSQVETLEKLDRDRKEAEAREEARQRATERPRDGSGKFLKQDQAATEYKPGLDPAIYDEGVIKELQRLHDFNQQQIKDQVKVLEDRLHRFEASEQTRAQREAESAYRETAKTFDSIVDGLGHDDLFGKDAGKLSEVEFKNRARLWDTLGDLVAGMQARGKSVPLTKETVKRALRQEFSTELNTATRKQLTEKVRDQSMRRLGGGTQKTGIERPYKGPPEKDPELLAAFHKLEKEDGGRV